MFPASSPSEHERLLLYRHVGCPYCERVVRVAADLGVPFDSRFVVPTHSRRDAVKRVSGQRAVPVLVDEERGLTMAESANIVAYLERTYGDAEGDPGGAGDGRGDEADGRPT